MFININCMLHQEHQTKVKFIFEEGILELHLGLGCYGTVYSGPIMEKSDFRTCNSATRTQTLDYCATVLPAKSDSDIMSCL